MATLTKGRTFVSGETVTPTKLNELVDLATVTNIVNADISASADIAGSKLADNAVTTAKINNAAVTAAKLDGAQTGSAPIYGCRAWVAFNGSQNATATGASTNGNPVFIYGSGNVTSVVKNSAGNYTVNFTTALTSTNYCVVMGADGTASLPQTSVSTTKTTTALAIATTASNSGTPTDSASGHTSLAIFA